MVFSGYLMRLEEDMITFVYTTKSMQMFLMNSWKNLSRWARSSHLRYFYKSGNCYSSIGKLINLIEYISLVGFQCLLNKRGIVFL